MHDARDMRSRAQARKHAMHCQPCMSAIVFMDHGLLIRSHDAQDQDQDHA